jgi:3-oxoacyl-[acyl-carrier protein] reductase
LSDEHVLLITGSRKGIGRALTEHYLEKGCRVVGCSRSNPDFSHESYRHFQVDVTDEEAVKSTFFEIRKTFGRLDVLINSAGIASMNHALLTPGAIAADLLQTNVLGTFLFCREAAKLMRKHSFGRIVNLGSVATPLKLKGEAVYAASKAAVVSLTEILAREFAPFGITVNAVGPAPIKTDLIRGVPDEALESLVQRQAIQRLGEMRDVSHLVDFLIQPESDFITGQVIYLGGV